MKRSQLSLFACAVVLATLAPDAPAQCQTSTPTSRRPAHEVLSVAVQDWGGGPELYVAEREPSTVIGITYVGRVQRWTGTNWELSFETKPGPGSTPNYVWQIVSGTGPLGPML